MPYGFMTHFTNTLHGCTRLLCTVVALYFFHKMLHVCLERTQHPDYNVL